MFDFDRIGDNIWPRFKAGKEGTVWYYQNLVKEFEQAWPDNPLLPELRPLVKRIELAAG